MYKLAEKRTVRWPVKIKKPQDGGKVRTYESQVEFEHLDEDAFNAIYDSGGSDADMLRRTVLGWPEGQFQNADGSDMPFSPENLNKLLQDSNVHAALVAAYVEIRQGREAARKN